MYMIYTGEYEHSFKDPLSTGLGGNFNDKLLWITEQNSCKIGYEPTDQQRNCGFVLINIKSLQPATHEMLLQYFDDKLSELHAMQKALQNIQCQTDKKSPTQ